MRNKNYGKLIIFAFLLILASFLASAQDNCSIIEDNTTIDMVVFYGETCPHCAALHEFLDEIQPDHPELNVHYYEIYFNKTNSELFSKVAKAYGTRASGVPAMFIGDQVIMGFAEYMKEDILEKIQSCHDEECINPLEKTKESEVIQTDFQDLVLEIPFIGHIDSTKMSLPVFTVILGLIDGFNPCAFFVLLFLLSMLICLRSRKRMLLVGGTFILFSGLVYFLFMAAWLNFFLIAGKVNIITAIAGIVAVIIAAINIKDFFFFKKGVSLTISDSAKPKLFQRMRNLLKAESISSMLVGAVVLAIVTNMYELLCTAGFPMVFTRILTLNNLPTLIYYLYLIMYNIAYIIPLAVIVAAVTITLGAQKLTEWQGEMLKLLSGCMMLFLGLILITMPDLLNDIVATVGILLLALIVTAFIILLTYYFKKGKVEEEPLNGDKNE